MSRTCFKILIDFQALTIILMYLAVQSKLLDLPSNRWEWEKTQKRIEVGTFLRRSPRILIKAPKEHCECPPFKECRVEFQPNEDMIDFLHIRGIINDTKAKEFRRDLKPKATIRNTFKERINDRRRLMSKHDSDEQKDAVDDEHCCCPPRSLMMPTYITDAKFDELLGKIKDREKTAN